MIIKLGNDIPKIDETVFIADTARVIGKIEILKNSSIWYGAVLRGDIASIFIGEETNIQDGTVVHGEIYSNVEIGNRVTVGHNCILHGCKIGDNSLIGMGSIITDGVIIPKNCFVSASSFITSKIGEIPEGSFIKGNPAKVVGKISETQEKAIKHGHTTYCEEMKKYLNIQL